MIQKEHVTYPQNAIELCAGRCDIISFSEFKTIPAAFDERVSRSHNKIAYRQFNEEAQCWESYSWKGMAERVQRWRQALAAENLPVGSRVAIQMPNSVHWIVFDQSALAEAMVVVPIFFEDRVDNIAYILGDTGSRLLFLKNFSQWRELEPHLKSCDALERIVILESFEHMTSTAILKEDSKLVSLEKWLNPVGRPEPTPVDLDPDSLATIVYTSGTTGKPKGVMLSHANILGNAYAGLQSIAVYPEDRFLSFLPLSHMFERTAGYYVAMLASAEIAFNRSISDLAQDMLDIKPSIIISVPQIFERVQSKIKSGLEQQSRLSKWLFEFTVNTGWKRIQYRHKRLSWHFSLLLVPLLDMIVAAKVVRGFGGNLRLAICGGAPLGFGVSKMFSGLGITILQGYGLTESSPTVSVNTIEKNNPKSIGIPYRGVEIGFGDHNELLVRSKFTMLGYWNNVEATAQAIDSEGWLHTGDIARFDDQGLLYITGRIKEIIVLANGEKVSPVDMELAIVDDPLFEQVIVVGEGRSHLTALLVLNQQTLEKSLVKGGQSPLNQSTLDSDEVRGLVLARIARQLSDFPGYAFVKNVFSMLEPWTIENGLITPTLKLRRTEIALRFGEEISQMYSNDT
jgi:long-chain acyl-CoA synthetase